MGWELLLLLVVGAGAHDPWYRIIQPESLSAPAGGSVTLPCNFTYPREIEPLRALRVSWRRGGYHGPFIYNHTERITHPDYRSRIVLVGDPGGSRTASIRIDRLRESDASEYVCQIRVQKNDGTWEQWRSNPGIRLTVTGQVTASTQHPEMVTTGRAGAEGTYPLRINTVHLILIGLLLLVSKAGICSVVFALGLWLGWAHGPASVAGRVSGREEASVAGLEPISLAQSSSPRE